MTNHTREKLVELLKRTEYQFTQTHSLTVENVAYDLFINGVTVQEWIAVTERLPEYGKKVLVCDEREDWVACGSLQEDTSWFVFEFRDFLDLREFTHWMPLPQPPKGE
jgi:hypothetical protein